tara:strand:- start:316 stop:1149 length:834 start_codon:yes stop_codon:yes gene_type:complete
MAIKPYQSPDIEAMFKQINPNQIAPGNAAGLGSGNQVSATAPSFFMNNNSSLFNFDMTDATESTFTNPIMDMDGDEEEDETEGTGTEETGGQDPFDLLREFFPDASDERLQELVKFVSVIPDEIREAADPDAEMYQLMRQERTAQLESQRDTAESRARRGLFLNLEQARGMEGKRGFALGRNIYGDVSEAAAAGFESVQDQFGRGLYNINQSIIDRVGSASRYLASLEAQQKGDMLKLADLADLFKTDNDTGIDDDSDDEEQDNDYMGNPSGSGQGD